MQGAQVTVRGGWVLQADDVAGQSLVLLRGDEVLPQEAPPTERDTALPEELKAELGPLLVGLGSPSEAVRPRAEVLQRLFNQGFEYSLTVDLKGKGHPLAVLIREKRAAYCSYFASAMVAALRTQGVAARLVTGFAPAEGNRLTGRTLVRARDAHAWVEAYVPEEKRWVAFDPTPWSSRDAALDVSREQGILGQVVDAVTSAVRRVWALVRYQPVAALLGVLTSPVSWVLVAGAALLVFGRRQWRARGTKKQKATQVEVEPRLRDAYARYLELLKRAGLTRAPSETDEELLARLRERSSADAARAAEGFIRTFQRERFRAPEAAALDGALSALDAALERRAPGD